MPGRPSPTSHAWRRIRPGRRVEQPMAERVLTEQFHRVTDESVRMLTWTRVGWLAYWAAVGVCGYGWFIAALAWFHQMSVGLQVTGLGHPVMWGAYITTFVFWIGLAHSGTFVSAILFLCRASWRTSIARA